MSADPDDERAWWIGRVVDIMDPHESGRLKVRIMGHHDDEANIPDSALPWAMVMQSVTSASIGRMGTAPVGAVVGTRVFGQWLDPATQQLPMVMGNVGRSGAIIPGRTEGGAPSVNTAVGSIPSATQGSPTNAYSSLNQNRVTIQEIDSGQRRIESVAVDAGVAITDAVKDGMKAAELPTTASAESDDTDILEILKKVDPNSSLSALPCLPTNLSAITISFNLSGFTNGLVRMLTSAVRNAILRLAQNLGIGKVLGLLNMAASGIAAVQSMLNTLQSIRICGVNPLNTFGILDTANVVLAQALSAVNMASGFVAGAVNLATGVAEGITSDVLQAVIVEPISNIPNSLSFQPASLVSTAPDKYVQNYVSAEDDPYPGYIQWKPAEGSGDPVFTLRNGQPNYTSARQHTSFATQNRLIESLEAQIIGGTLSSSSLGASISSAMSFARQFGVTVNLGSGSILGSAASLIPFLASNVSDVFEPRTSTSTLPTPIAPEVNRFTENQTLLAQRSQTMQVALTPPEQPLTPTDVAVRRAQAAGDPAMAWRASAGI